MDGSLVPRSAFGAFCSFSFFSFLWFVFRHLCFLFVSCCSGTMLSFDFFISSSHFIVLLLLFGSTMVSGVCTSCYGREPNCSGDTGTCPWNVELAANVAAIVTAGSTATLSVVYQLPVRLMRVFSRAALTVLTSLHRRPKPGEQLNLSKADGTGLTHGIMWYLHESGSTVGDQFSV